jgi:hypothetical protein
MARNGESQRSEKPRQDDNIMPVQPEIQGIARNFAPLRFIDHLRHAGGVTSVKD